jgi:hypothetical protein
MTKKSGDTQKIRGHRGQAYKKIRGHRGLAYEKIRGHRGQAYKKSGDIAGWRYEPIPFSRTAGVSPDFLTER